MTLSPEELAARLDRAAVDASARSGALHSQAADTIRRLVDTIDGLDSDLFDAVSTAYRRGAVEWTRLNYPSWIDRIAAAPPTQGGQGG